MQMAYCYEGAPVLEEDVGGKREDHVEILSVYNAGYSKWQPADDCRAQTALLVINMNVVSSRLPGSMLNLRNLSGTQ
jgi:hypothetical protein